MKLLYLFFIVYINASDNVLYEFSKFPENYQPSGMIIYPKILHWKFNIQSKVFV